MSETESGIEAPEEAAGAEGEAEAEAEAEAAPAESAVEQIDAPRNIILDSLAIIGQRRLPALDFVNDRFVRSAKGVLFNLIRRPIEFVAQPARVRPYGEVMRAANGRPHLTLSRMHPLAGGVSCWAVSGELIYLVVDTMFGGDSRVPSKVAERDLSATELRILRRMMDGLTDEYEKAWQPVREVKFEFQREESDYSRADICGVDDLVLHCGFVVKLGEREGLIDFCVPFWMLDPIKSDLYQPPQSLQKEIDTHWTGRMESQVQAAEIELVAVLAREEMKIADVLALNVGDIVPIEVMEPITGYVDGLPMVLGQYGVRNGRYAIKVSHVKHPADLVGKTNG